MTLQRTLTKWLAVMLALAVMLPTLAVFQPTVAANGVQTYEAFEAKTYPTSDSGIAGNGDGREVSSEQNHTSGGSKSIRLTSKGYKDTRNTPQTVVLDEAGERQVFTKGKTYTVSAWLYSAEAVSVKYRIASVKNPNDVSWGTRTNEKEVVLDLPAATWTPVNVEVTLAGLSDQDTGYMTLGVTYADSAATATTYFFVDDVKAIEKVDFSTLDYQCYEDFESKTYSTSDSGIAGNGDGREVSDEQNHTPSGSKSIRLTSKGYKDFRSTPQTVVLDKAGVRQVFTKGKTYTVSAWLYSAEAVSVKYRIASVKNPNDVTWGVRTNEKEVVLDLPAATWTPVTVEVTLAGLSDQDTGYMTLGVTYADSAATATTYFFVDDVKVAEKIIPSPVTTFNGGLLYTGGKVGSLNGEVGSAVYTVGDTQYTAMRVAADYTCVDNDPTKVVYGDAAWTVVGRGVLLNYSAAAAAGGTPTLEDTASYQMKNYVTGDALKSYWSLEDNTLRYSVLVKNVNEEKATGLYLTYRSYMVITDGTNEVTVYGNTVSDVTVEKLYNAATQQGVSVKWFGEQ